MAAVFAMQPIGQLCAQLAGLFVVLGRQSYLQTHCGGLPKVNDLLCKAEVDRVWRIVTGVGAFPALLAIIARFLLWDAGVYLWEVKQEIPRAIRNSQNVYPTVRGRTNKAAAELLESSGTEEEKRIQFSVADLRYYFIQQGNWRYLAGTSICWFLLDFAFFGLGMNNPRTISKLFADRPVPYDGTTPSWNTTPQLTDANIYQTLLKNAEQGIYTVCIASIAGSALFIVAAPYIRRRQWLIASFVALGVMFIVAGGTFFLVFQKPGHYWLVVAIAICHFLFNFGANTLTFMIPAEIFPSTYRCTCHGIAAASGKFGSIVVQLLLMAWKVTKIPNSHTLGKVLIGFGGVMIVGAFFAWAWIPEVQNERVPLSLVTTPDPRRAQHRRFGTEAPSKTLEELGEGFERAKEGGQAVGFDSGSLRNRYRSVRVGRRGKSRNAGSHVSRESCELPER